MMLSTFTNGKQFQIAIQIVKNIGCGGSNPINSATLHILAYCKAPYISVHVAVRKVTQWTYS